MSQRKRTERKVLLSCPVLLIENHPGLEKLFSGDVSKYKVEIDNAAAASASANSAGCDQLQLTVSIKPRPEMPETASTGISHADDRDVPRPDSGLGKTKTSTTSIHLGLKQATKDSDKPKPTPSPENLSVDNTTDVSSPSDRYKLSFLSSPYIFTQTSSGDITSPAHDHAPQEPLHKIDEDVIQLDEGYVHTLYHVLHGTKESCSFGQRCEEDFDESFASNLHLFLDSGQQFEVNYGKYIEDHFKNHCPSSSTCFEIVWKCCGINNDYSLLREAEENMLLYSKRRKEVIGKVCSDYVDYDQHDKLGSGGFGNVYMLNTTIGAVAVKEEYNRPLMFHNPKVFGRVMNLENDHVIPLLEYIIGGDSHFHLSKRQCLLVMPYMNQGGLHEHFKEHDCIIQYMLAFNTQEEYIFKNFIVLFSHVFKGLQYLHSQEIIHGDVKDANILVHQKCLCSSPLQCKCANGSGVKYVLGDMDLFCVHGESVSRKYVEWARAKHTEPAGTDGMKATELYFTGVQGEQCMSDASDVWAGSVTMMKIFSGDYIINLATKQIGEYFDEMSLHSSKQIKNIIEACKIASQLEKDVALFNFQNEREKDELYIKERVQDVRMEFKRMKRLLRSGSVLAQGHWIVSYTYPEKLPLPFILGAVYGANSLRQYCLEKLPHIYSTPLWTTMQKLLEIITEGVRFLPQNRLNASKVLEMLEELP